MFIIKTATVHLKILIISTSINLCILGNYNPSVKLTKNNNKPNETQQSNERSKPNVQTSVKNLYVTL